MAAIAPVAIGTRGTVGSLVRKEIEYFSKLELDRRGSSQKPQEQFADMVSSREYSRPGFWFFPMSWKRKKGRGTSGFLPSICNVMEVAGSNKLNRIPGYSYRILNNDINNFQV